jgi:GTPase SAR1 family protein
MNGIKKYPVRDVFTPTTPARLTFVERGSINYKLVNALRTPGKQVVVYGHSGSGKTTLLTNKLDQLYERHVSSRCMRGLTFEQLILDAFDQLSPFYIVEKTTGDKQEISAEVGAEYWGIKSQISTSSQSTTEVKHQRILPPQLTPQALARFLGEAKCCWVLEDFHKIDDSEKTRMSQLMKVFMDMADLFKDLKIVAIGAVDTARQVIQYDAEMRNRVAEIHVPLMTDAEVMEIIQKGESLLNIKIEDKIKKGIVHYSNGLASVCHHICLNTCVAAGIQETAAEQIKFGDDHMKTGLAQYLEEASDTLKYAFDRAFKQKKKGSFDNCKIILQALSKCPQDGATHAEILDEIDIRKYPTGNLTLYLRELQTDARGSIIRCDTASGKFSFTDPIYRAFCLAYFEKHPIKSSKSVSLADLDFVVTTEYLNVMLEHLTTIPTPAAILHLSAPAEPKKSK